MPEVRPFVAGESVLTGSTGPSAHPSMFDGSGGNRALQGGVEAMSGAITAIGARQAQEERRIKSEQDAVWVGETLETERRSWIDWLSKDENAGDPEVGSKFIAHAKQRVTELSAGAPSERARLALRQNLANPMTRAYDEAATLGRKASLSRLGQSFDARAATALSALRAGGRFDDTEDAWKALYADIDRHLGKVSPEAAKGVKEKYELDLIYATIDEQPDVARKLITNSTLIDERQRRTLLKTLDSAVKDVTAEAKYNFEKRREDVRVQADIGKSFEAPELAEYEAIYGKDAAKAHLKQDEDYIGVMRGVFNEYSVIQEKHPAYQGQHLAKLAQAIETGDDALKVKKLAEKVAASSQLFSNDRVGWLSTNNDEIRRLNERIVAATPEERGGLMTQRADALLRFQGNAPEGLPSAEAAKYLNLPEHDKSVLTSDEAEQYAAMVNKGSPSEAMKQLDQLLAQFPNDQHRVLAFNDMVRLPHGNRGVRQELQLAMQNRGAWWMDSYVAAINQGADVQKLGPNEYKDLESKLFANGTWLAFQRSMIGDNLQRADELAGFKQGILSFAQANILKGTPQKEAVSKAVDMLISESLAFTEVNGRALVIPRQRVNKTQRSNEEIESLGRRLSVALSYVDPAKIDDAAFEIPDTVKGTSRWQIIRDHVTSSGFFQPLPDGQGVSLYVADDLGDFRQVRDKKGRAFKILYDDLPEFTEQRVEQVRGTSPQVQLHTVTAPVVPRKVYDLMQKTGSDFWGTTQYRSNWPIQPNWLRNE